MHIEFLFLGFRGLGLRALGLALRVWGLGFGSYLDATAPVLKSLDARGEHVFGRTGAQTPGRIQKVDPLIGD